MNDIAIFKAADDMSDGIGFANIGEKFIAEAFAFGSASNQAGNIDEFNDGRLNLLWFNDIDQRLQAWVWYLDDPNVGFYSTERIVFSGDPCIGDCIKQGGFTHIW